VEYRPPHVGDSQYASADGRFLIHHVMIGINRDWRGVDIQVGDGWQREIHGTRYLADAKRWAEQWVEEQAESQTVT
jgi:hypothetical protein